MSFLRGFLWDLEVLMGLCEEGRRRVEGEEGSSGGGSSGEELREEMEALMEVGWCLTARKEAEKGGGG